MTSLLDTTVLIDLLRGNERARRFMLSHDAVPHASEVSRIEVWRGVRTSERAATEALFSSLAWHPLDEVVARRAGELGRDWRDSHSHIALADLAVAATAELNGLAVATANVRHFPMFDALSPPY